ncbi:DUF1801 domain-containing protein [Paenibacillus mucilaginosus]|uniref:YdhG-like domain-containing protein n=1 Tax=Paenibacillus mucilaginosus (strain KNP414) TaxID=1036673 RepID=F8F8S8_PAEMK|nr:DUF1801 domain-containing protein [Paenibacillus mucilaginosus]AEI41990.1 Domain of unknown function DUF1801 [Paenibacillus mucilaginosus KNP414]MCG7217828.1 DUF1801 domain-containing protein [Paenibacillus mucilaginosus]WDM28891.1 DUF1801 domain-containing protein [Paenibacillus mucilaginosus]
MSQEVLDYIGAVQAPWQAELCVRLREAVHGAIPDVQERMQYKKPHFLRNGKYAAVISVAKDTVSFTIFNAADLILPEGLFEGPPERKTLKLRQTHTADFDQLTSWVREAAGTL